VHGTGELVNGVARDVFPDEDGGLALGEAGQDAVDKIPRVCSVGGLAGERDVWIWCGGVGLGDEGKLSTTTATETGKAMACQAEEPEVEGATLAVEVLDGTGGRGEDVGAKVFGICVIAAEVPICEAICPREVEIEEALPGSHVAGRDLLGEEMIRAGGSCVLGHSALRSHVCEAVH